MLKLCRFKRRWSDVSLADMVKVYMPLMSMIMTRQWSNVPLKDCEQLRMMVLRMIRRRWSKLSLTKGVQPWMMMLSKITRWWCLITLSVPALMQMNVSSSSMPVGRKQKTMCSRERWQSCFERVLCLEGTKFLVACSSCNICLIHQAKTLCTSDCICDEPPSWKTEELALNCLEDVEISGLRGTEHEIDVVNRLFSWPTVPKRMTGNLHDSVTENKA